MSGLESSNLVFVYGTLRRNQRNSKLLDDAILVASQCWTSGEMYDTHSDYPFLLQSQKERVYGELYQVDLEQLEMIEHLEDYKGPGKNNLYDRVIQTVNNDTGSFQAFVYVKAKNKQIESFSPIKGGDWSVYCFLKEHDTFLYFAYGSCMDNHSFKEEKVDHYFKKTIGRGVLEGFTLRYSRVVSDGGRADIVEEGGIVEGKVYLIPSQAIPYLHKREGVKYGSYRPAIVPIKLDNNMIREALTYIVVSKKPEVAPPADYMESIIRGGIGYLSPAYLNQLKEKYKSLLNQRD